MIIVIITNVPIELDGLEAVSDPSWKELWDGSAWAEDHVSIEFARQVVEVKSPEDWDEIQEHLLGG